MKKIILASFPLLMVGCTTLDSTSDFTDAVKRIESKQNYQVIVGKALTPDALEVNGGQLVKSSLELNYIPLTQKQNVPDSFIKMELQYFKNYNEFKTARVEGSNKEVTLKPYAASAETCSDVCTQTQYVRFPVSSQLLAQQPYQDLKFDVTASNANNITFSIPSGYIEAIVNSANSNVAPAVVAAPVAAAAITTPAVQSSSSKAIEMTQYWFEQTPAEQRDDLLSWAVENRNSAKLTLTTESKQQEMFGYWYGKATKEERKTVIKQLLEL
ncbi:DUF2057 domain-containing protein [Vibrio coralliilyticus]|uniref:DUF2057 domain-containing protein n=1 Tax=Vibrio coralliilyticus TaxID=190893 RepID=UPI00148E5040|nr:DUF2057 domain-containing protein [Vibrio coralliilyticus]NOI28951.1 DUF2057 domain-containing protein [Vibrio coralliilyticus]NOI48136.1 DUF2057 domain-containing protein [Vibrio coralliilyticus]